MSTWADELRSALPKVVGDYDTMLGMLDHVKTGERQLEHALNTVECLVEANAALREQLCSLKAERRVEVKQPVPQPPDGFVVVDKFVYEGGKK